jgi:hypothetical protein
MQISQRILHGGTLHGFQGCIRRLLLLQEQVASWPFQSVFPIHAPRPIGQPGSLHDREDGLIVGGDSDVTCTRCYVAENSAFGIDVHSGATVCITASEIVKNEQAPTRLALRATIFPYRAARVGVVAPRAQQLPPKALNRRRRLGGDALSHLPSPARAARVYPPIGICLRIMCLTAVGTCPLHYDALGASVPPHAHGAVRRLDARTLSRDAGGGSGGGTDWVGGGGDDDGRLAWR